MPNQLRDALEAVGYVTTHAPDLRPKDVLTPAQKEGLRALRDEYRLKLVMLTLNPTFRGASISAECQMWLDVIDTELPPCDEKENVS